MKNDKPVRVAQIIGKMWSGGVEAVVFNYYKAIDKDKIQFDFYYDADSTIEPPEELINMGAKFYKLPPYQKLWKYIPALYKKLKKNRYVIVHSHLNTISVFPLFTALLARVPVRIAHNHSVPGGKNGVRNVLKKILRVGSKWFATDYFACSKKAACWLFGEKEYEAGNVIIIKNAIDTEKFCPSPNRKQLRAEMHLENNFVLGHVGRLTYAKNHAFILEVFKKVLQSKPNAKLLLVGSGELELEIKTKIKELGIEDSVLMVGNCRNTEKYYQMMDVFIMPSFFEGLGLAAVEAQMCEVPIVISDAIPKEAIIAKNYQYHNLSESVDVWAQSVIQTAEQPQVKLEAWKEYDITYAVKKLEKLYLNKFKSNLSTR